MNAPDDVVSRHYAVDVSLQWSQAACRQDAWAVWGTRPSTVGHRLGQEFCRVAVRLWLSTCGPL